MNYKILFSNTFISPKKIDSVISDPQRIQPVYLKYVHTSVVIR